MRAGKIVLCCCLLLPFMAWAESGTVVRATQLVAEPFADAASRGTLREQQTVEIRQRQGGWYQVQADDGREGWLRLSSIRLGEVEKEESGGFWASLFSFTGRSQARTASATTGIRGLSEEEINDAVPNPQAVERLAGFYPDASEARAFAGEIGLRARQAEELPAESKAGTEGGRK